jgi:TetR/AcrR family fatty acid metabolism transcriptional regulator
MSPGLPRFRFGVASPLLLKLTSQYYNTDRSVSDRRYTMKDQDKRERIIKAAERLFSSRRYHEVTLDEAAKAAKVGKGTIYLHFQDKDDLFIHTASAGFDQMSAQVREALLEEADLEQKLRAVARPIRGFFEGRRWIRAILHELRGGPAGFKKRLHEERRGHFRQLDDLLAPLFREAVEAGAVRPDVDPKALARLFFVFIGGHTRAFEEEEGNTPSLDTMVDVFLHGVVRSLSAETPQNTPKAAAEGDPGSP